MGEYRRREVFAMNAVRTQDGRADVVADSDPVQHGAPLWRLFLHDDWRIAAHRQHHLGGCAQPARPRLPDDLRRLPQRFQRQHRLRHETALLLELLALSVHRQVHTFDEYNQWLNCPATGGDP